MKRTPADDAFSRCVRERANWVCELCKTEYPDGQAKGKSNSLDCSHFIGRGNWSVRFDAHNAFAHCAACHFRFGADKYLQEKHYIKVFGEPLMALLEERKHNSKIGRMAHKQKKEIEKHYRSEYERMRKSRAGGCTGRLEFENWI